MCSRYDGNHGCTLSDPLHTGDHICCCDHEWPVDDEEWQETKRAMEQEWKLWREQRT